jgi:cyclase
MKTCSALLVFLLVAHSGQGQRFESRHFSIEKLADGVFAVIHKPGGHAVSNAGIIDLGAKTLVFDSFISPEASRDLKRAAEVLTGNNVAYVVNSHFHNDHIRGNQVFAGAEIISTRRTKELIEKNEPEELASEAKVVDQRIDATLAAIAKATDPRAREEHSMWLDYYKAIKESQGKYTITAPNLFLNDTMIIRGSTREVTLLTRGKGHTESDIVLWLPKERILFAGDLLFVESHPWFGDGYMTEWIEYLRTLKRLNAVSIIPGHGPVGQQKHIDRMIDYIETVTALVDDAVQKKLTSEQLAVTAIPEAYKEWKFRRFFAANLAMLYNAKTGAPEK